MRLIFASLASHGHVYPLLPLAFAARDAGHEVLFATGAQFQKSLRDAGLATAVSGIELGAAFTAAHTGDRHGVSEEQRRLVGAKVFGDVLPRHVVPGLRRIIEEFKPDLVVHELADAGTGMAAALAGVPALCHAFGRAMTFDGPLREAMAPYLAELGLPAPGRYPLTLGNTYLDIYPPSLQDPEFSASANRIPLRPVAWNEPGELPEGIRGRESSRPLVYLTLGTAFGHVGVLKLALAGLSRLPVDVLLASGPAVTVESLGAIPGNVRVLPWVPQADLLPHLDLVVHHGGSGTTLGAFAEGLPQLVLPQGADQFTNADAVLQAGSGARILPGEVSPDAVAEGARALLASEPAGDAARRVATEIAAMPSPAEISRRLPELV